MDSIYLLILVHAVGGYFYIERQKTDFFRRSPYEICMAI